MLPSLTTTYLCKLCASDLARLLPGFAGWPLCIIMQQSTFTHPTLYYTTLPSILWCACPCSVELAYKYVCNRSCHTAFKFWSDCIAVSHITLLPPNCPPIMASLTLTEQKESQYVAKYVLDTSIAGLILDGELWNCCLSTVVGHKVELQAALSGEAHGDHRKLSDLPCHTLPTSCHQCL